MRRINVRFYSLHIRSKEGVVNYSKFFREVAKAQGVELEVSADYTIVLDALRVLDGGVIEIVLLGGDRNAQTVFYDRVEGGAVVESSSDFRWAAKPTRVVVDLTGDNRIVGLESTRGGVTPALFERYLERIELSEFSSRSVDITPLASESFLDEIEDFERIRLASVEVTRPNLDWDDQANHLYELADESGAQSSTAEVKAPRGESLNKHRGLLGVIRQVASNSNPSIKNAKITGRKPGDVNDRTVSLSRHQEKSSVEVDQTAPLGEQNRSVLNSLLSLIESLRDRYRGGRQEK